MAEYEQFGFFQDENPRFLTEQIITYIGNKRSLLSFLDIAVHQVQSELNQTKLDIADVFSGSGIVSRFFKKYAQKLYVNDLEKYCETINRCYLSNKEEINFRELTDLYNDIKNRLDSKPLISGFISKLYSPKDDNNIQYGERVFFTSRNANYIDTARQQIELLPKKYKPFLLAPLIYEASVHNNTSGVFKGFYKNSSTGIGQYGGNGKNALQRIMSDIELHLPVFSNFSCSTVISRMDANTFANIGTPVDLAYLDPPYNQHPYGSNYFMLNLIDTYEEPKEISRVSGIPTDWNKSQFNKKQSARSSMQELCKKLNAKYLLISFNDDGFISKEEMLDMLYDLGDVEVFDKDYNTFRGCRNLSKRSIYVKEYLYLVKKK